MLHAPWLRSARRFVADQLVRLRGNLEQLAYHIRERVATLVGEAVEGICRALMDQPDRPQHLPGRYSRQPSMWGNPDERWPDEFEDSRYDQEDRPIAEDQTAPRRPTWLSALAIAAETAGWWLRNGPRRFPLVTTLGAGALTATATFVGAPLVVGIAGLAGSIVGLMATVDRARAQASILDEAVRQ
jgi:hypothetical protein